MSTFVTELFWAEEKQAEQPLPGAPHDLKDDREQKQTKAAPPVAIPENHAERLQRVAGNAALARQAEEAEAARKHLSAVAQRPTQAPSIATAPAAETPARRRREKAREPVDRKASPAEKKKAAEKRHAEKAAAAAAKRLPDSVKAAARRTGALAGVLADFEHAPGDADLLGLALLVEDAPPEIAEGTARALAKAAMRADSDQRAAIAARIKDELGSRRDLRLSRLLSDRLAWAGPAPRAAPPPPPAPPD